MRRRRKARLRIVAALLFLQHGAAKLFGVPHVAMFDGLKLFSLLGAAGVIEVVGGLLLLVGLFTRPVAFILSGQMAVAYFFFHACREFLAAPQQGRTGGALLFRLPVLFRRRTRRFRDRPRIAPSSTPITVCPRASLLTMGAGDIFPWRYDPDGRHHEASITSVGAA